LELVTFESKNGKVLSHIGIYGTGVNHMSNMMKLFLTISFMGFDLACLAQGKLPDLSPKGEIMQTVGYTHFVIRYERPAVRGRKIMGDLVSYNKLWRTGAGKCTTIQFDQPVKINNRSVAPGIYALLTIPSLNEWTVMLSSDTSKLYGDPSEYDLGKEIIRLSVKPRVSPRFYESLSIELDVADNDAILFLSWENTQISFVLGTNTYEVAEEKMRTALQLRPTDVDMLSSAAYFYEMNNRSLTKALEYVRKAMTIQEERWYYRLAVDILVKMKNYNEAIATAQQGISFLERTHPVEWEESVRDYQKDIAKIAAMK
jgi:tetratricopeptide (TPR) repeat protein